jgi:hypothetical protein
VQQLGECLVVRAWLAAVGLGQLGGVGQSSHVKFKPSTPAATSPL